MNTMANPSVGVVPPSEDFFKVALNDAILEAAKLPVTLPERQVVRLKPGFNTACWTFVPPHKIFIGTELFSKSKKLRKELTAPQMQKYIASHYHHERAHALYTERNFEELNKVLAKIKAPFALYNLFEDARIESRYRKETAYQFEWLEIEELSSDTSPSSMLFGLIQSEGRTEESESRLERNAGSSEHSETLERFKRVLCYYENIVKAEDSMALLPILKAWIEEFPNFDNGKGYGVQDVSLSMQLGLSPQSLESFENGTLDLQQDTVGKASSKLLISTEEGGTGKLLGSRKYEIDSVRVEQLVQKLSKIFRNASHSRYTEVPTNRISATKYLLNRPAFKSKSIVGKKKQSVLIVLDCSGSMEGKPIAEGRVLLAALSQLASRNFIDGKVILSAVSGSSPRWQRFALPMADAEIERVDGLYAGEGLQDSLSQNWAEAQKSDYVFVYTDGAIGDKRVDKAALHRKGIFTWGLYVGSTQKASSLLDYFDKCLVRDTVEELADSIVANKL